MRRYIREVKETKVKTEPKKPKKIKKPKKSNWKARKDFISKLEIVRFLYTIDDIPRMKNIQIVKESNIKTRESFLNILHCLMKTDIPEIFIPECAIPDPDIFRKIKNIVRKHKGTIHIIK